MKEIFNRFSIPQIIVGGFASVILIGAFLLMLPVSSASGQWSMFLDCLFTATSAVCVTGQVVYNTAEHWSLFGQLVIISLIQVGGLGFMGILTLAFLALGRQFDMRQQKVIQESLNLDFISEARPMMNYLIRFSLSVQLIGALLLSVVFIPDYGLAKGSYFSVFHSISAFNNAGFDLFGDSLLSYTDKPYVILVIAGLIFTGGLGFVVWRDILSYRKNKRLLLHTRLVLTSTISLLLISFILFMIFEEAEGTFSGLKPFSKLANYLFLAVTPRTAGYANVDYSQLTMPSLLLTLFLMFVGGASGSTAGGIKVNTLAIVILYIIRIFQDRQVLAYNRAISDQAVRKALYIFTAGLAMIFLSTMILSFTEEIPESFGLEYILMEVVSCFGTVGLTMGLTPHLTSVGKIVLILLMLAGRVGLMTFFWAFGDHSKQQKITYPEASVMVG